MNYKNWSKIIHKEGYIFILLFAIATFIISPFSSFLGFVGSIATAWCVYFFRNPDRVIIDDDNNIISPADGVVQSISECLPPKELGLPNEPMLRISIFLNIFNVHVNRVPTSGKILQLNYHPGKFFNFNIKRPNYP